MLAVAIGGLLLQILSSTVLVHSFWGFHLYYFVPRVVAVFGWIITAVAAVWFVRSLQKNYARESRSCFEDNINPIAVALVLAVVCIALFWFFRSQQTLLGDARPLIRDLPDGKSFHPRQPLTMFFQQVLYQTFGGMFAVDGEDPPRGAFGAVALGSVAAGFLYSLVAAALGFVFSKGTSHSRRAAWLVALVLLAQGYTLLFYGYIENYTFSALAVGLYALVATLFLQGRFPLAGVAAVLVGATGLHLSMVLLYPSFVFLLVWGYRNRRIDTFAGLGIFAVLLIALNYVLGLMSDGYSLWNGFVRIAGIAGGDSESGSGWSYMLSARHLRDFFNNQYLLGPVAALVLVPLCLVAWRRRLYTDPIALFLSVAALTMLAVSWATAELQLGYARDWDLFAPAAVMYSAAALYLLLKMLPAGFMTEKVLVFALVVSIVNIVPWVWINHSESRSLSRFKTLPLGEGRTELVVANWYRDRGRHAEAKLWFEKSLVENPNNVDANSYVGLYHTEAGEYELARPYFERAVVLRPDKKVFRTNYANVLLELDRFDEAAPHLVWLAKRYPGNLDYWFQVGDRMAKAGNLAALSEVYDPVFARLDKKLADNPRDDAAIINKGLLLTRLGRLEESVTCYQRALDLDPNSASALFNAAVALDDLGRDAEARNMYLRFLQNHPVHQMAGYAKTRIEGISAD